MAMMEEAAPSEVVIIIRSSHDSDHPHHVQEIEHVPEVHQDPSHEDLIQQEKTKVRVALIAGGATVASALVTAIILIIIHYVK